MLYDEVIRARQSEIFNEVQDLEDAIIQTKARLEKLVATKEQRILEHRMLQHISDRGLMDEGQKVSRIQFEDALRNIFDQAGRPMSIGQLIDELERFGYMWSNYHTARYQLLSKGMLQSTGARGYYNLLK